ncbi:MAG: radical SAM protein [Victivallaceae bacterium]|nr:radical SAM protein [Victivallaceae bacterium]
MNHKYVFGPIGSRRLGVSLGVDLVPAKTCTQDCPYCEAGWTTNLTLERREYVPFNAVAAELSDVLDKNPQLDCVTFSGAGEPTLNSRIGEVARFVKTSYPQYRLVLLTNGTLLGDDKVIREVEPVDLIIPDLDASNAGEFAQINRPAPGLTFDMFVAGLRKFCAAHAKPIWLEMFIAPGINDSDASIARFSALLKTLKVDKIQLNTLDRPGCDPALRPAPPATLRKFITAFEPFVPVETVGAFRYKSPALRGAMPPDELSAMVINLAKRRQVTRQDIMLALNCNPEFLDRVLNDLLARGLIECEKGDRGEFFGYFD